MAAQPVTTYPTRLEQLLPLPRTIPQAGRLIVSLLSVALLVVGLATAASNWHLTDLKAYLAAADLLASGGNPFDVALMERGLPYHYHYSPWFAALFVPLTGLPVEVVRIGWSGILIAASVIALAPVVRTYRYHALPLVAVMTFLLSNLVAEGNVQPLLLAALVWSLEHRWGPVAIGVAASLKITPILLALVYARRGQWARAALSGGIAAILVVPTFLYELPPSATSTGGTGLFTSAPVIWGASVVIAIGATWWLGTTRFAWLAVSTATVLALPRLLIFDVTNLITAIPRDHGYRADRQSIRDCLAPLGRGPNSRAPGTRSHQSG